MNRKVYKVFGIVTNIVDSPLEILLWHRKRCGKSEQEHSRLTKDMAGGRFPSDSFGENTLWWYLSIISLNLLKMFQRHALQKELSNVRIKKLNTLMFRITVKVVKGGHTLKIKIGKGLPLFDLIVEAQKKIKKIYETLSTTKIWIGNKSLNH